MLNWFIEMDFSIGLFDFLRKILDNQVYFRESNLTSYRVEIFQMYVFARHQHKISWIFLDEYVFLLFIAFTCA